MVSTAIERWDKVLDEVQRLRQCFVVPLEVLVPGRPNFEQGFHLTVNALTQTFNDAWDTDRPIEGSPLYEVLERVADATHDFDFSRPAAPQVAKYMSTVGQVRIDLAGLETLSAAEVVADVEKLIKTTVLVARLGHQGSMDIATRERDERNHAINKATSRSAQFLDLDTMMLVKEPSATTLSMAVFLAMVDPGIATPSERMRFAPDEENPPEIMAQFAAQWVVHVHTEWDEHYRDLLAVALGCDRGDIKSDYFADINRMRQDYVHNRGTCRNSARNRVLKWYRKGQRMIPTHANYRQLLTAFPGDELLLVKPPSAEAQRQQIKANADPDLVKRFEVAADHLGLTKDAALDQAVSDWLTAHDS